jgi:hypothetical protein
MAISQAAAAKRVEAAFGLAIPPQLGCIESFNLTASTKGNKYNQLADGRWHRLVLHPLYPQEMGYLRHDLRERYGADPSEFAPANRDHEILFSDDLVRRVKAGGQIDLSRTLLPYLERAQVRHATTTGLCETLNRVGGFKGWQPVYRGVSALPDATALHLAFKLPETRGWSREYIHPEAGHDKAKANRGCLPDALPAPEFGMRVDVVHSEVTAQFMWIAAHNERALTTLVKSIEDNPERRGALQQTMHYVAMVADAENALYTAMGSRAKKHGADWRRWHEGKSKARDCPVFPTGRDIMENPAAPAVLQDIYAKHIPAARLDWGA